MTDAPTPVVLDDPWAELERLAKAATPGEWKLHRGEVLAGKHPVLSDHEEDGLAVPHEPDLAWFAAANPATVLKLIEDARQGADMRRRQAIGEQHDS